MTGSERLFRKLGASVMLATCAVGAWACSAELSSSVTTVKYLDPKGDHGLQMDLDMAGVNDVYAQLENVDGFGEAALAVDLAPTEEGKAAALGNLQGVVARFVNRNPGAAQDLGTQVNEQLQQVRVRRFVRLEHTDELQKLVDGVVSDYASRNLTAQMNLDVDAHMYSPRKKYFAVETVDPWEGGVIHDIEIWDRKPLSPELQLKRDVRPVLHFRLKETPRVLRVDEPPAERLRPGRTYTGTFQVIEYDGDGNPVEPENDADLQLPQSGTFEIHGGSALDNGVDTISRTLFWFVQPVGFGSASRGGLPMCSAMEEMPQSGAEFRSGLLDCMGQDVELFSQAKVLGEKNGLFGLGVFYKVSHLALAAVLLVGVVFLAGALLEGALIGLAILGADFLLGLVLRKAIRKARAEHAKTQTG